MLRWLPSTQTCASLATCVLLTFLMEGQALCAQWEQLIPILGVTNDRHQIGTVSYVRVLFDKRQDKAGMRLHFHTTPGRFSNMAQTSIQQAIIRSAHALGISTNSWTVELSVPHAGVTMYGDSLSAMVSLSVAGMAQGRKVSTGHVLTGTVTHEGAIGPVGSVPLKVQAARAAKLRRVVVSRQNAHADGKEHSSPPIQISPVESVSEALEALTGSSQDD